MSLPNYHVIAVFFCKSVWSFIVYKEPTHKVGNCFDLLTFQVDPLLGKFYNFSISFSLKMGFKNPNITFFKKVYLKSRVDWSRVSEDLCNFNWSAVYNSLNSVSELNKAITFLIDRRVPSKVIKGKVNDKA